MKSVHTTSEEFKNATIGQEDQMIIVTPLFSKNFIFKIIRPHEDEKPVLLNPSCLKSAHAHDGLRWTVYA